MTYRISNSDYEIWDNSKDGNLMYNIFNTCKICKGNLRESDNYKPEYDEFKIAVDVPEPICIMCIRDEKIEKLKI